MMLIIRQCKYPARLFLGGNNEPIVGTNKPLDLGNLFYAFCDNMSKFPSYDNCYIRLTQFYLVQTELLQAVGRAILNRNKNNEVLLFSNFPLQKTHSFYINGSCIRHVL